MEQDSRLEQIRSRVNRLQDELEGLQKEQGSFYDRQKQQCSTSLAGSLQDLFKVILYVQKADRSLLGWHRRGDNLKLVLRVFGYDRRTSVNVNKKTAKLKTKVSMVETSFQKTTETFDEAATVAEDLNKRFAHFSVKEVDSAYGRTREDLNKYEEDKRRAQTECETQKKQHRKLKSEVNDVEKNVQRIAGSRDNAALGKSISAAGSILGFSAATLSALIFPPSLAITGALAAGGALAGGAAVALSAQISELEQEHERLETLLTRQETCLQEVETNLANLDQKHDIVIKATEAAQDLQVRTRGFRSEAQLALKQIREVRIVLYTTQSKLIQITDQLKECGYLESRHDIASELRYILDSILGIKFAKPTLKKQDTLSKAIRNLVEIDGDTVQILALLRE